MLLSFLWRDRAYRLVQKEPWATSICIYVYLRALNSDANWFCCYLRVSHFGSVPPDVGTRSVVCGAGRWRKEGGVVIRRKQSLPAADSGGTVPVRTEVAHARRSLL